MSWRSRLKLVCPECFHVSHFRKCCLCAAPLLSMSIFCKGCVELGHRQPKIRNCQACGCNIEDADVIAARPVNVNNGQMSGWLETYNDYDRKYHRRFYVIHQNFLYGYKNVRVQKIVSLNFLEGLKIVPVNHGCGHEFGIEVTAPSPFPYQVFYANSNESWSQWLSAFRKGAYRMQFEDYYTLGEPIGEGHFAKVFKCTQISTGKPFAVKIIAPHKYKDVAITEAALFPLIRHPNIVSFEDMFNTYDSLYLVMSYEAGGDLYTRISQKGAFPERTAAIFMKKLINAVMYLHQLGIAHRDIKPENIVMTSVDSDTDFKLVDFGLCLFMAPGACCKQQCGTFADMAPEMSTQYDFRIDIWNVGIIMYFILTRHRPFKNCDMKKIRAQRAYDEKIQEIKHRKLIIPEEDTFWASISLEAKSLLKGLMHHDAEQRITLKQALDHAWFTTTHS